MAFMDNVIILNIKAVFLPDFILQSEENASFLKRSTEKKIDNCPYFDPIAVKEIQKIAESTTARIVITDNWFWTRDFAITKHWFKENGLSLDFHDDYSTPKKMSSSRINEIQWWIENHPEDNIILILDEHYSMKNVSEEAKEELRYYNDYLAQYSHIIGAKRRASTIPFMEHLKYEDFTPSYGIEAQRTVAIQEKAGLTTEVIKKSLATIKKATR